MKLSEEVTSDSCVLCGSVCYYRRPGHARDNSALVPLECAQCGLVRLSSFTHIDNAFYARSHMHDNEPCDEALMLRQGARDDQRRFGQWRSIIAGKRYLDFGCGAGGFLLKAREIASFAAGVEPESRLHPFFARQGLTVWPSLEAVDTQAFDVISMFHVLEHLPDPISVLSQINSLFKSEGTLIIEVPNANDALLTLYENEAFSVFTYWSCHLWLFTEDTLRKMVELAGFRCVEVRQFQRYPLANHLYWLAKGKPGGQDVWKQFCSAELEASYAAVLAADKRADTLIGVFTC